MKLAVSLGLMLAAMASAQPLVDEEIAGIREWHQTLGLAPLDGYPLVKVSTGGRQDFEGGIEGTSMMALLVKGHTGDGGNDFEVMTIDRELLLYSRRKGVETELTRIDYEVVPLDVWLAPILAAPSGKAGSSSGSGLNAFFPRGPSSSAATLVNLAMFCRDRGRDEEARQILARLSSSWMVQEGEGKLLKERLQHEFGHALIWQAMLACDDPANPRAELLAKFQRIADHCPESRHVAGAQAMVEVLKRMLAEDEAHAAERAKLPFDQLSREEQIADLIFQLRNQDGGQFMQPGKCSIFGMGADPQAPAERLVGFGLEAVPQLIEALEDERLTYSVGYHRNFHFSHRVLRVGEGAGQIIERICNVRLAEVAKVDGGRNLSREQLHEQLKVAARQWRAGPQGEGDAPSGQ